MADERMPQIPGVPEWFDEVVLDRVYDPPLRYFRARQVCDVIVETLDGREVVIRNMQIGEIHVGAIRRVLSKTPPPGPPGLSFIGYL